MAHNYVAGEVQDIADFTGDSLELSIKAAASSMSINAIPFFMFRSLPFSRYSAIYVTL